MFPRVAGLIDSPGAARALSGCNMHGSRSCWTHRQPKNCQSPLRGATCGLCMSGTISREHSLTCRPARGREARHQRPPRACRRRGAARIARRGGRARPRRSPHAPASRSHGCACCARTPASGNIAANCSAPYSSSGAEAYKIMQCSIMLARQQVVEVSRPNLLHDDTPKKP